MAILLVTDFTSQVVADKITKFPKYIDDALVTVYWHNLADILGIEYQYLPDAADITEEVRQYLICSVMLHVSYDNIGSVLKQVGDGIAVDEWERRYNIWKGKLSVMESKIKAGDVYDPTNPPPTDEVLNPNIINMERA